MLIVSLICLGLIALSVIFAPGETKTEIGVKLFTLLVVGIPFGYLISLLF